MTRACPSPCVDPRAARRRASTAFTLVELLIAVALGAMLVMTATAGVRVVSQAATTSRRMGMTNDLLRIGVQRAVDETDYWQACDDPLAPATWRLRGRDPGTGAGFPFTPLRVVRDPITGGDFIDRRPGFVEDAASPRGGWNANPLAWAAWDPRAWTRANLSEESSPTQFWGTFGIYGHLDPSRSWHHWYDGQVRGLIDAMGFYGLYDYLPSNAFVVYHGPAPLGAPAGMTWGGMPEALLGTGVWLAPPDGGDNNMKGRIRNSNGSRYFLPGPTTATAALCRSIAFVGYEGRQRGYGGAVVDQFLVDSLVPMRLTPLRPAHWPDVGVEVRRFVEHGHPVTACVVRCREATTGEAFVLPFTCVGTTLRGARGQRHPDGGWADPYTGPTLDVEVAP